MLGDSRQSPAAAHGGDSTSAVTPGAASSGGDPESGAESGEESGAFQLDAEREEVARYWSSPLELLLTELKASCEVVARYTAGDGSLEMRASPGVSGTSAGVAGVARSVRPTGEAGTSGTRSGLRSE